MPKEAMVLLRKSGAGQKASTSLRSSRYCIPLDASGAAKDSPTGASGKQCNQHVRSQTKQHEHFVHLGGPRKHEPTSFDQIGIIIDKERRRQQLGEDAATFVNDPA